MSITCKFLSEEFAFHDDLLIYLDALAIAEEIQGALFNLLKRKVASSEIKVIDNGTLDDDMRKQASRFIKKLCNYNIYDKTIDEYAFENEGYKMFSDVNSKALKAMSSFLLEEMENLQRGMERAEANAVSNITGTGVQVWSSSFLTLAATSAYEYSVLKKQANKADQQYQAEIQLVSKAGSDKREQQEINYLNNIYFPEMTKALTLFAYSMLDHYLADLNEAGLFDNEALKYVNVKHSRDLLQNMEISPNKDKVLISAFQCCPFNVEVFFEAEKLGLVGSDEIETLRTLQQLDVFFNEMKRRFIALKPSANINSDIDSMQSLVKILCLCSGKEPIFYYKQFAHQLHQTIVCEYEGIRHLIETPKSCEKILNLLGNGILDTTEQDLLELTKKKVLSIATSSTITSLMERCGYPDMLKEIAPNNNSNNNFYSKVEIDNYYVATLSKNLAALLEEKQQETQIRVDTEARNKRKYNSNLKKRKTLASIILAVLLVLPIIIQVMLASTWVKGIHNYLEDMISENIQKESQKENSYFNEAGLKYEFEITSVKYYKEVGGTFYIAPEVTYNSDLNNLWEVTASLATHDLCYEMYRDDSVSVPFYIASIDKNDVVIMDNSTVIQNDEKQVHCNHFDDFFYEFHNEYSKSVNPYLPIRFLVFYVMYAIVLLLVYRSYKKKDYGLIKIKAKDSHA